VTPFKHNIRKLRKVYRDAAPVRRHMIHVAALANDTCQRNLKERGALDKLVPHMEAAMDAVGVQPATNGKER
jgi:hypothetical protein